MNSPAKIIIGLVIGALVVCVAVGAVGFYLFRSAGQAVGRSLQSDPSQVSKIMTTIADYELPSGFGNAYATQVAGFDLVAYTGDDNHSHIYFFQLPSGITLDPAEIERQFRETTGEQKDNLDRQMKVVDQVAGTLRGQATTLVVSEGVNRDGQNFRQVSGMFQGKGGQAMVVFERPASSWDQAEVDAFLASIR